MRASQPIAAVHEHALPMPAAKRVEDEEDPLVSEPEEDAVDRGQAEPEDEARPEAQSRGQKPAGKRRHEDAGRECAREQADRALRQAERGRVAGQERRQDREERGVDQDHGRDEELESAHPAILLAVAARGRPWLTPLTVLDRRDTNGAVQDTPSRPPTPREAASVILVRDVPGGLEVLLLQRHPESRFSPGAYAFPGGRVEPTDAAADMEARCRGLDPRRGGASAARRGAAGAGDRLLGGRASRGVRGGGDPSRLRVWTRSP